MKHNYNRLKYKSEQESSISSLESTESMASNFMPVDRMNRRSSESTGSTCLPQPRIKISKTNTMNESSVKWGAKKQLDQSTRDSKKINE